MFPKRRRAKERESHAGRRIVAAAVGSARCSVPFRSRSGEFRGVNIANGERRAAAAPSSLPLHRAEIDRINSGSELAPSSWKPYLPLSSLLYYPRATTIASAISFPPSTPTLCRLSLSLSLALSLLLPLQSSVLHSLRGSWFERSHLLVTLYLPSTLL